MADDTEDGEGLDEDTLKVVFRKPVTHGETTYKEITLREPTWGELKGALKQGSLEASTWLASLLGKIPVAALNQLGASDGSKIDKFFGRFT